METFHKQRILFFWASTELELLDFRKNKQTETIWHGKTIDLEFLIQYANQNKMPVFVFGISYSDDTECAHIEMHDRIDPPSQSAMFEGK